LPFNVLLNVLHAQHASLPRCIDHFGDKSVVTNRLFTLHDADNSGLSFKVSIGLNALMCLFVLFLGFLQLNLVDFDSVPFVAKSNIERKGVGLIDLATTWIFSQWLKLGAR
jgi:hypothetical protein